MRGFVYSIVEIALVLESGVMLLMQRLGIAILGLWLIGCDNRSSSTAKGPSPSSVNTTAPAGMSKYPYNCADGGPL